ncbi:MAG: leucine-rich repeat domain-containing protein, partial [Bacteroidales bacterium]|nr:leucine-rich repeat domain-containing protein [Bacteroidales bacterium]
HGEGPMRDYSGEAPEWEQYKDQILAVSLDDGITSVGAYAFYNYLHLTEARLPDSVEVIDVSAFDYDWELRTITIPASLKYVGSRAFYNTLLWEPEDLIFPEGCEYIGDEAFHSALKSGGIVSLPSTLKYLGSRSFTNAFLSDFIVSADNEVYRSENHAIYTKDMKEMRMLAPIAAHSGEFRIPDGVEKISAECFNVIQGIETVYIPASVTDIEEEAFFSTFDLKEIIVDEANPNYKSENGLLLSKDGTLLLAWPDGIETNELVIPEGVERIGAYLFYGRTDGSYSVILPESVREIGTMSLPYHMASLTLPAGLEKIDEYVLYDGISIDNITYNGTAADWEKITIGDGNTALD